MSPNEARLVRNTALAILALVALRLAAAGWTPLTFDQAYYLLWSKNLTRGYYDLPPGVSRSLDPVRRHRGGGDRGDPPERHADGGGRHPHCHAGFTVAGGRKLCAVFSCQSTGDGARCVVARGRRRRWCCVTVEIHLIVFRPGDLDLAGGCPEIAALADLALAISRRPRFASDIFAGHPVECS